MLFSFRDAEDVLQYQQGLIHIAGNLLEAPASLPRYSDELAELLRRHHLRPLAHALGMAELQDARRECSLVAAFHARLLGELDSALANDSIAWAPIKGAAYAWRFYDEPGLRPMSDIDILVRKADFALACQTLESCGFLAKPASQFSHAQTFVRAAHEIVDLHHSILQPLRSNGGLAQVWSRATPSKRWQCGLELDIVDLCVIHIAHMARSEFVLPLVSHLDLHKMLEQLSGEQRERLEQQLAEQRLHLAFQIADELKMMLVGSRPARPTRLALRLRLLLPSEQELVSGRHSSRRRQILRKLLLFPQDSVALGAGWLSQAGFRAFRQAR